MTATYNSNGQSGPDKPPCDATMLDSVGSEISGEYGKTDEREVSVASPTSLYGPILAGDQTLVAEDSGDSTQRDHYDTTYATSSPAVVYHPQIYSWNGRLYTIPALHDQSGPTLPHHFYNGHSNTLPDIQHSLHTQQPDDDTIGGRVRADSATPPMRGLQPDGDPSVAVGQCNSAYMSSYMPPLVGHEHHAQQFGHTTENDVHQHVTEAPMAGLLPDNDQTDHASGGYAHYGVTEQSMSALQPHAYPTNHPHQIWNNEHDGIYQSHDSQTISYWLAPIEQDYSTWHSNTTVVIRDEVTSVSTLQQYDNLGE
ncbi:hypothetical protein C8Q76DRAFT_690253 [Earliella scabrosa]|nr:hypothetical protein C8Q76DRAFT_690253 [Earliella scabrosa]